MRWQPFYLLGEMGMIEESQVIRFDWAIKTLLRDKANFGVLAGFLSAILGQRVTVEKLLESESNQENESNKFNPSIFW